VNAEDIRQAINPRLNRLLLFGQMAMSESQFKAFRKLVLDELGNSGLHQDLDRLLSKEKQQERQGKERS